jgi:hypothetical protein
MSIYSFTKTALRKRIMFFGFAILSVLAVYCGAITAERTIATEQSGMIVVRANSALGTRFRNTDAKPLIMEVFANGRWSINGGTSYCGPAGYPEARSATNDYRLPGKPLGALIVRRGSGEYEFVGGNRTIRLESRESVYFGQNDNDGGYGDNVGTVKIEWTGDYEE